MFAMMALQGVRNSANQQMILRTCEALGIQDSGPTSCISGDLFEQHRSLFDGHCFPCEELWLVPPPSGAKYRAAMVRSRHASRGAERQLHNFCTNLCKMLQGSA